MLSIVIPVYNVAPYLRECLSSVVKATEQVEKRGGGGQWNVEIICVDDGSTDGSGEILDEYAAKDGRFRVIHQRNAGVSVARQVALEMCQGEWIAAVDADDWVDPDYFARLLEATAAGDVDMVWCGFTEEREGGTRAVRQEVAPDFRTQVLALLDGSLWGVMWTRLISRQFVIRHQLGFLKMRVDICEDILFVASVLAAGARVKHVDATGYHYRMRTGSSMRRTGGVLRTYLSLMAIADRLETVLQDDWAIEPLGIWRKKRLKAPCLDASIPDDVFFAHNGGCKDLWGTPEPFHHKLLYWFAARGGRSFIVRMVALTRKWRGLE